MLISEDYRRLNRELHEREPAYGVSGRKWAETVRSLAESLRIGSLLDYGCGKGTLRAELMARRVPYAVNEYDPAVLGKERWPAPADLVVCGDVMEHIEPEALDDVLGDLHRLARIAAFLVIATRPAKKVLADGRNAHLIVEPAAWWLPKLIACWRPQFFHDVGGEFIFVGMAA